ncbi:MAG: carboxylesterase family protein [Nakamurella sp.]
MTVTGAASIDSAPGPEVRTAAGRVGGNWESGLAVFRGIPYAEPPVGPLRFAAPRRCGGWAGVRAAVAYGPPPPQPSMFGGGAEAVVGDDWLTLNIWSPDPAADARLPVLVWIPGGAYTIGAANLPEYDGGRLAAGGLVVVTINYRLGVEGFAQIAGAPANRGLLDQVAALQWVQDSIGAFGGDPKRVTIFGESAGAGSVAALLAMPRANGLFRRAIAQSVPGPFFTPALATDIAGAIAAEVGLRPTVDELSSVEPVRLTAAGETVTAKIDQWQGRWGLITHRRMPFAPVVDGDVLPATPWEAVAAGAGRDVALLVGHTRDEHRLFSLMDGTLGQVTIEQAEADLRTLAPGPDGASRYRQAYPAAGPEELYELVNSDWLFRMPSLHLGQAHAAAGGRTHIYELTWPAPGMGGGLGACHGLDVPLVFGNLSSGHPAMLIGQSPSAEAEALSGWIRRAWTAFAADGDPGWPVYDTEQRLVQLLDTPPVVTSYPEDASRLLWQQHTFPALPLIDR